ncbi:MAG: hypothetical protein ACTSPV_16925 [Candidatus Hodarchaeales archaeon]
MLTTFIWFGVGILIFLVLYFLLRKSSKTTDIILSVASSGTKLAKQLIEVLDKDPARKSFVERLVDYANIAVASVEQSYKYSKEEMKKAFEDGKVTKEELEAIYRGMKTDAINIAKELAKLDGIELSQSEITVLGYIIEAMVWFLPKPEH